MTIIKPENTSLESGLSSLKVIDVKTGSIVGPGVSSGSANNIVTIPHGLGNDSIIVICSMYDTSVSMNFTTPYSTNDGRFQVDAYHDATNIYLEAGSSSTGSPTSSITYNYTLFICVP